ncbi:MAG: hypothetical protein ACM3YE_16410 [Bacteroidota bacterium]
MKKAFFSLVILCLAILVCAFTSSNIVSFKDPNFNDITYDKILIVVSINDLNFKELFESTVQSKLLSNGINALTSVKIIPPLRKYSEEEITDILNKNEIQAVLIINILNYQENEKYIPPISQTTSGNAYVYGNSINFNSTTSTIGGYNLKTLNVQCHYDFVDVKSGKIAWIAESKTKANGLLFTTEKSITKYISDAVIKKLIEDQLIVATKK